jgi:hypothetical protein
VTAPAELALAPTETTLPITPTLTLTPTPSALEYVIREGDTLIAIVRRPPFNHRDLGVLNEVVRINSPLLTSPDRLPPPGTTILIPLPTPQPTQPGSPNQALPVVQVQTGGIVTQHIVVEGETILGIADQYNTTLRILRDLNPDIAFVGCDFSNPSGGPDCSVFLEVGQPVNVPQPTPTPTLSPTPSGSETPTPTPTFSAPRISFPPRDAAITASSPFALQWVSVGILEAQQVYLVQIEDVTAGAVFNDVTADNSYLIPVLLVPADTQPHQFRWRVSVARLDAQGRYELVGGEGEWRSFVWSTS